MTHSIGTHSESDVRPYPLVFAPVVLEKIWGGRRLERLGKSLPTPQGRYGESWEVADLASTSASGAGGGAVRSIIANGPLAGRTLGDAVARWGSRLIGSAGGAGDGHGTGPGAAFPLLVKFLDASENLSVQVHPSPAFLKRHPERGAHLKTESWYIVDAEPGAKLYTGLRPGLTRAQLEAHIRDGSLVNDLLSVPAVPGECHTLPSGTVHALGAGVLVAEVQTPSDTTFRVFDWGRTGRELHIADSLASASFADTPAEERVAPAPGPTSLKPGQLCARLATTPFYTIDEARPLDGDELTVGYRCCGGQTRAGVAGSSAESCFVLMVLAGTGELRVPGGAEPPLSLSAGNTVVVPASVAPGAAIKGGKGLRVLRVGVGDGA